VLPEQLDCRMVCHNQDESRLPFDPTFRILIELSSTTWISIESGWLVLLYYFVRGCGSRGHLWVGSFDDSVVRKMQWTVRAIDKRNLHPNRVEPYASGCRSG
jgi:hypothetical protein